MDQPKFHQHGGPNPSRDRSWKRVHHSPFFWVAACFILLAMIIYVVSGDLSFRTSPAKLPTPALAP